MNLSHQVLAELWLQQGLSEAALRYITLDGDKPGLASSFQVGAAAQSSIGLAALAAAEIWRQRTGGNRQQVRVSLPDAEYECTGYFKIDGRKPDVWAKFSGLYPCADGFVRLHANFTHHRDGILQLLGLPTGEQCSRAQVETALMQWQAEVFETAATAKGLVVAKVRAFEEWDVHPQAQALDGQPLITIDKIAEAEVQPLTPISNLSRPLTGLRVLDLTRILAGPTCGRTLATYGAEVMLVNSPHLPNVENIIDTSRGKYSALIDLNKAEGQQQLLLLANEADIFVQGYRPGGITELGFSPDLLAQHNPHLVYVSLSAYGNDGPWAGKRGFDSLVQTATGFNLAEAEASGSKTPKPLPVQILDYASGFLMAFGAQVALLRRATEGGSWHVQVSLAQTARWLRAMGRRDYPQVLPKMAFSDRLGCEKSGFGQLEAIPHAAKFQFPGETPGLPSVPPGTHKPIWAKQWPK
ncbi:MAG: CoA transferase [Pseudomonadales bacterium]|nr:CoA transferase [Pseudomonadales bacterium]